MKITQSFVFAVGAATLFTFGCLQAMSGEFPEAQCFFLAAIAWILFARELRQRAI